jgi:hypothetical protein
VISECKHIERLGNLLRVTTPRQRLRRGTVYAHNVLELRVLSSEECEEKDLWETGLEREEGREMKKVVVIIVVGVFLSLGLFSGAFCATGGGHGTGSYSGGGHGSGAYSGGGYHGSGYSGSGYRGGSYAGGRYYGGGYYGYRRYYGGWRGGYYRPYYGWYGGFGPGWYPYGYPYPYAYPYPSYPPVVTEPPLNAEPQEDSYWYFCEEKQAYYPYVASCPGGWARVVPAPPQPGEEGR